MTQTVTLALPDPLAQTARVEAARTNRRVEDVLIDWLDRAAAEASIDSLPDDQLLRVRDQEMTRARQDELHALLERQREAQLVEAERARLDSLMALYRQGLVLKAKALKVAVDRGLQPPLDAPS